MFHSRPFIEIRQLGYDISIPSTRPIRVYIRARLPSTFSVVAELRGLFGRYFVGSRYPSFPSRIQMLSSIPFEAFVIVK